MVVVVIRNWIIILCVNFLIRYEVCFRWDGFCNGLGVRLGVIFFGNGVDIFYFCLGLWGDYEEYYCYKDCYDI